MAAVTDPAILAQLEAGEPESDASPSVAADIGTGAVAGVPSALASAAGVSGDIRESTLGAGEWLANKVGVSPETTQAIRPYLEKGLRAFGPLSGPSAKEIKDVAHRATGISLPEPETRPGQYAKTVTEFVANPISYAGPGSAVMKGIQALSAGLGSEWVGGLLSGQNGESYGRIAGAVTGALLPRMAMRTRTPLPIPADKQSSMDILSAEGITPTAGQQSGSKAIRYMEGELGDTPFAGGAATREHERVGREFTNAVLARVGETWKPNERITSVVDRANNRVGGEFDLLARNTKSPYDNKYVGDLWTARDTYDHLFVDPLTAPIVKRIMEHATNKLVRSPHMDGEEYKALRSKVERTARGSRDPEVKDFLTDVRSAMDDLVERHMGGDMAQAWRDTRNKYRNLIVLNRVVGMAGQDAAHGNISPAHLRSATRALHGGTNYARGRGDYAELARAGEDVLSPLPQSGTAPRAQAHRLAGLFAGLGGAGGYAAGDAATALYAAGAGATVPAVMGRGLMSRPVQKYLRNQRMTRALRSTPKQTDAVTRAIINARRHLMEDEEE